MYICVCMHAYTCACMYIYIYLECIEVLERQKAALDKELLQHDPGVIYI